MAPTELEPLTVKGVPAFQDNYLWLIARGRHAAVVDPGDAAPIEAALREAQLTLGAILLTHHHPDHIGGVAALLSARPDGVPVFGPAHERIDAVTHPLQQDDLVDLAFLGLRFRVLDVPGHTSGHIAYFTEDPVLGPLLFCGDTLFACGCGRLFEGTAEQMQQSLARIAALPDPTRIYCAHEYTLSNLRFALAVEPDNAALKARAEREKGRREAGIPTVPSVLAEERATNPFLRWDIAAVKAAAERQVPGAGASPALTFGALRSWKDRF